MTRTRIAAAGVTLALAAGAGLWFYKRADAKEAPAYRLAAVERGTVRSTVSATGVLNAVRTVQVGTQASGQVSAIYVDFNDQVKKGQLIARIDPTLQQQSVQDAQAGLERAQAQLDQASREYDRGKQLFDAKVITESEFVTTQANFRVADANVKSADIALGRARQNLSYTNIYAPIDGVIVERNVDVGQTVAASFSAPQLFLIANDLTRMQILASVDESDIGKIKDGQSVSFGVSSYANDTFSGTVEQVRLQSTTTENVVNYTVVVSVSNATGKLLPGMTATVKFLTSEADGVLTVPNAALRYRPATAPSGPPAGGPGGAMPNGGPPGGMAGGTAGGARPQGTRPARAGGDSVSVLWKLDAAGNPAPVPVRAGLSDGQRTQITVLRDGSLDAGAQIIVGAATAGSATAAAANPFQQTQQQGGGRPPGPPPGGF